MFVCCECCVLSGRGFCDELITHPEESYWLWCVVVCDQEPWWMRRSWPAPQGIGNVTEFLQICLGIKAFITIKSCVFCFKNKLRSGNLRPKSASNLVMCFREFAVKWGTLKAASVNNETRWFYRVIKKSVCTWRLQYTAQVHRDFLIILYN